MNTVRSRVSTFQARHAMIADNARRKLIDNQMFWISNAIDCVRMRARKSYEGDTLSWIVDAVDIVSAVFPPLSDVPYRKVNVDPKTQQWSLTSLISAFEDDAQEKMYTLQIPFEFNINVGDLLFRILLDEAQKFPIIIPMQVKELLGTFGGMKMIMNKCQCVIPTEDFPQEIVDTIKQMAERRQIVGF